MTTVGIFIRIVGPKGRVCQINMSSSSSSSTQSALTFYALGFTLGIGSVIGVVCFLAFGVAVYFQCPVIAPRCTARPKETIYHPNPFPKDKYQCQDRGNPLIGWIAWVMKMPYDTMLNGVPGTGTRKKGLAGRMLQVNLDGVVMLRYHLVGFRLTLLITVLALGVILPVNLTANCYSADAGLSDTCIDPSNQTKVLTDFERTTIANISPLSNVTSLDLLSKGKRLKVTNEPHILYRRLRILQVLFCYQ